MRPDSWTEAVRERTARAALDDTAALVALHRLISSMDVGAPPTAQLVTSSRPLEAARRIGLFAGSFNPLTRAHLAVADAARSAADLDAIVWALSAVTIDKERVERASLPDRLAQVHAYVQTTSTDALTVLNRGLYVDEAQALRRHLAHDATLFLLVGFDKIVQIFDQRYYADRDAALHDLFAVARLLVAPRAGQGAEALVALLDQPANRAFAPFVAFVPLAPVFTADSSTEARTLAAALPLPLRSLRPLLPPEGIALARTGAYLPPHSGAPPLDRYALRSRWLAALAGMDITAVTPLPALSRLVSRSARPSRVGARLCAWLEHPEERPIPGEVVAVVNGRRTTATP